MRRLGFTSDAGYRFERGVDPALGPAAIERATALILAICGGRAGPRTDVGRHLPARAPVRVRTGARRAPARHRRSTADEAHAVFARLGAARLDATATPFVVTPPSWRFDLAIEEDFVEEVARVRGYDTIPADAGGARAADAARAPSRDARRSRCGARSPRATGRRSSPSASCRPKSSANSTAGDADAPIRSAS